MRLAKKEEKVIPSPNFGLLGMHCKTENLQLIKTITFN